jgi:peptide deformylase
MTHHLIYYGHETLKQKADQVETFDQELIELIEEMYGIMKKADGIGLAAPQINVGKRILTIDISAATKDPRLAIVNPEIVWKSNDRVPYDEGCLSVPGIFQQVDRPSKIVVHGFTPEGKEIEYKADDLLARVFQHEIDHLDGILFIDHLDDYIRKEYTKELKKIKKMNKE